MIEFIRIKKLFYKPQMISKYYISFGSRITKRKDENFLVCQSFFSTFNHSTEVLSKLYPFRLFISVRLSVRLSNHAKNSTVLQLVRGTWVVIFLDTDLSAIDFVSCVTQFESYSSHNSKRFLYFFLGL